MHDLYYLWSGLTAPLLGEHSYRQTQTAITAYWARRDGLRLAYETPIMGAPWSVPLELPLYQWFVAGLNVLAVPVDAGGRILSFVFLVACAWPFAIIRRALALPPFTLPLTLALFLSAPLLIFWGRAVLMESCAVFLALLWLALMVRAVSSRRFSLAAAPIALVGSLAILQKSTTFAAFGLLGGGLVAYALLAEVRRDKRSALRIFGFAIVTCLVPLAVAIAWIRYSDGIKEENPFGFILASYTMNAWNYGTLAQRFSIELLQALQRGIRNILGLGEVVALLALAFAWIAVPRYRLYSLIALGGFLAPYAIFTNLHIRHDYYQVANAVFLVCAIGFALSGILATRSRIAGIGLLLVVVGGQLLFFHLKYGPSFTVDYRRDDRYRIANVARQRTDRREALLVLGQDYSSAINYYSERKGIALSSDVPKPLMQRVFDDPEQFLGGMRLGGIVACRPFEFGYGDNDRLVDGFLEHREVLATEGRCRLYAPARSP